MNEFNIAINDDAPVRRAAMASVWGPCNVSQYWIEPRCDTPMQEVYTVVLQHYDDVVGNPFAEDLRKRAVLLVYFGGDGLSDRRWDEVPKVHNCDRICRPVSRTDGTGALKPEEATTLLAYAVALKEQRKAKKPAFLRPPQDYSTLCALSVLCQGYLMAKNPQDFGLDSRMQEHLRETSAESKVENTSYWLDVFGNIETLVGAVNKEFPGAVTEGGKISVLLEALGKPMAPTEEAVRDAFQAIDGYLRTSPALT